MKVRVLHTMDHWRWNLKPDLSYTEAQLVSSVPHGALVYLDFFP